MPLRFLTLLFLLLLTGACVTMGVRAEEDMLKTGVIAPDFSLTDQNGRQRELVQYRGRWVVVYFYPRNNTPGCTTEACKFRDDFFKLEKLGADVLGISIDNRESHMAFAKKHGLPFPLLADSDGVVAKKYGSLFSFGPLRFARRHTIIVDPQGRIAKIYRKVDPEFHSTEVIQHISALQKR